LRESGDKTYEVTWDGATPNLEVINCRDKPFPESSNVKDLLGLSRAIDSSLGELLSHFSLYQFEDGSALVVNISHCIADGYSFFYFLSRWAARVKLGPILFLKYRIFAQPVHDRNLLVPSEIMMEDLQYSDLEVYDKIGVSYSQKSREQDVEKCVWRYCNFSNKDIDIHRDEYAACHPRGARLSSNDIISAIVINKSVADGWFPKGVARISIAFDYRRVLPVLSPRYFGNAVRAASFEMSVEDLEEMTENDIAKQVRRAKESINLENSLESLRYLEMARLGPGGGLKFLQGMRVVDEDRGLLLTDISRVSTDQFDFGYGRPTRLISLTPAERTAVISSQGGGYSVRVSPPHGA
jgi:hypothetical protein